MTPTLRRTALLLGGLLVLALALAELAPGPGWFGGEGTSARNVLQLATQCAPGQRPDVVYTYDGSAFHAPDAACPRWYRRLDDYDGVSRVTLLVEAPAGRLRSCDIMWRGHIWHNEAYSPRGHVRCVLDPAHPDAPQPAR